jgi:hypothetical protein
MFPAAGRPELFSWLTLLTRCHVSLATHCFLYTIYCSAGQLLLAIRLHMYVTDTNSSWRRRLLHIRRPSHCFCCVLFPVWQFCPSKWSAKAWLLWVSAHVMPRYACVSASAIVVGFVSAYLHIGCQMTKQNLCRSVHLGSSDNMFRRESAGHSRVACGWAVVWVECLLSNACAATVEHAGNDGQLFSCAGAAA